MNLFSKILIVLSGAVILSGCDTIPEAVHSMRILKNGPGVEANATEVENYRQNADLVLAQLYISAGITDRLPVPKIVGAPPGQMSATALLAPAEWSAVITAGMNYADSRCTAYMQALFRLNRNKNTTVSELGLAGTAAAGAMAAAASAAKDVALVAIAFGFAASSVTNVSSNLLYDLDPSSVQTMVQTLQVEYKKNIGDKYTNRPGAEAAIRGYALLCTPTRIESEVNLAVKKATPDATIPSTPNTPPYVTNASLRGTP